jgi:hypothetical protein
MTDHAHLEIAGLIATQSSAGHPAIPSTRVEKLYRPRRHKSLGKQVSFLLYLRLLAQ